MPNLLSDAIDDVQVWQFQQDFSGGQNSFHRATLIDDNQCQRLVNVIVRDNYEARTRPGADAIPAPETLPLEDTTAARSLRYFETPTFDTGQLLAGLTVDAAFALAKYETGAWTDITPDLNAEFLPVADSRLAMAQGIDKLLISCGAGQAQIYDGATFTNAGSTGNDCPGDATILLWHTARMFASGRALAPDTIYVSNLLNFVAGQWNWTTRSFRVGNGDGDPIVAMATMQGATMCVFKRNSVWLVNTDPSQDGTGITGFTAATVTSSVAAGVGCVGRDAWCNYGNDVLFMAQDGIRSVQRMQAAAGQWQLSAPISQPVQDIIARINRAAWSGIVAAKYQEFAFFALPLDGAATNNHVLVWNGRLEKWVGLWTGWNCQALEITRFSGDPKLVFAGADGYVNKWKDADDGNTDETYTDNGQDYPTKVWSKAWQFGEPIATSTGDMSILRFSAGNTTLSIGWVADNAEIKNWTGVFEPSGDILGEGLMPFLLASTGPVTITENIRGLVDFSEAYVKIESTRGWFWLKSIAASAFPNPVSEVT